MYDGFSFMAISCWDSAIALGERVESSGDAFRRDECNLRDEEELVLHMIFSELLWRACGKFCVIGVSLWHAKDLPELKGGR